MQTTNKEPCRTYFTSDLQLHFGHKNICKYTDRLLPEATIEDHTEWMISIWNSQVNPEDTVYHLGDFSFYKHYPTVDVLKRLKGRKIFIKGNHDPDASMQSLKKDKLINDYKLYDEIKIRGLHAVLFHFNIRAWHKQGYGSIHLFGHSHGNLKDNFGLSLDVGIDSAYNIFGMHKFFTEEDVVQYMQDRKLEIADHHAER